MMYMGNFAFEYLSSLFELCFVQNATGQDRVTMFWAVSAVLKIYKLAVDNTYLIGSFMPRWLQLLVLISVM